MAGRSARWCGLALAALLTLVPGAARAVDCVQAVRLLWPGELETPALVRQWPAHCASQPWAGGLTAVAALPNDRPSPTLLVGLLRERAGRPATATAVAAAEMPAVTIGPLWTPELTLMALPQLGEGVEAIGLRFANSYLSTARSSWSEALHILVRRDATLVPVLAVLLRAGQDEVVPCPRGRRGECRRSWTLQRVLEPVAPREARAERPPAGGRAAPGRAPAAAPATPGRPPDLLVRDAASHAVVSRHRWTGERYEPPISNRLPGAG